MWGNGVAAAIEGQKKKEEKKEITAEPAVGI